MTNLAEKARKTDDRAFNTWFNRWNEQYQLEKQVLQSASKGYNSLVIFNSDHANDYERRRFTDARMMKRPQESYPDLTFEMYSENKTNIFNISRVVKLIVVRWGEEE